MANTRQQQFVVVFLQISPEISTVLRIRVRQEQPPHQPVRTCCSWIFFLSFPWIRTTPMTLPDCGCGRALLRRGCSIQCLKCKYAGAETPCGLAAPATQFWPLRLDYDLRSSVMHTLSRNFGSRQLSRPTAAFQLAPLITTA